MSVHTCRAGFNIKCFSRCLYVLFSHFNYCNNICFVDAFSSARKPSPVYRKMAFITISICLYIFCCAIVGWCHPDAKSQELWVSTSWLWFPQHVPSSWFCHSSWAYLCLCARYVEFQWCVTWNNTGEFFVPMLSSTSLRCIKLKSTYFAVKGCDNIDNKKTIINLTSMKYWW